MSAFRRACRSIKDDPDRTADLGSQVFSVSQSVFRNALARDLPRWETDARLDMQGLESALEVQEAMGLDVSGIRLDKMVTQL